MDAQSPVLAGAGMKASDTQARGLTQVFQANFLRNLQNLDLKAQK